MDFTLSKEQKDIKRAAARFARGEFTPELAQECEFDHRFPRELYKKAAELGFIGIVEIYEGTVEVKLNNIVRILKKLNMDFIGSSLL